MSNGRMPTLFALGQVEVPGGGQAILVHVSTPVGQSLYFITPEQAKALGAELQRIGRIAAAGRVLPGGTGG